MKHYLILSALLGVLTSTGCTSKAKARLQSREAFVAGQQQVLTQMQQRQGVTFVGNVQNQFVPWVEDLTLATGFLAADYRGLRDPRSFVLRRNGQTFSVTAKQLLQGEDFALQPGDVVEVVP